MQLPIYKRTRTRFTVDDNTGAHFECWSGN